ncbi:MAG: hypothetical protein OHK0017_13920 [Patescibacteria group bacterium]
METLLAGIQKNYKFNMHLSDIEVDQILESTFSNLNTDPKPEHLQLARILKILEPEKALSSITGAYELFNNPNSDKPFADFNLGGSMGSIGLDPHNSDLIWELDTKSQSWRTDRVSALKLMVRFYNQYFELYKKKIPKNDVEEYKIMLSRLIHLL